MQSTILSRPFLSQFLSQPKGRVLCFPLSYSVKDNPSLSHILTHNKNHWLPVLANRPTFDGAPKTDGRPTRHHRQWLAVLHPRRSWRRSWNRTGEGRGARYEARRRERELGTIGAYRRQARSTMPRELQLNKNREKNKCSPC
jgi:hypothetical protein